MRAFVRILLGGLGVLVLVIAVGLVWLFLYSSDLPDMKALAQFAHSSAARVSDPCLKAATVAIPYDSIGDALRGALSAVEVSEDDPGVLVQTYRGFTGQTKLPRATLSLQISRTMFCTPSKALDRQLEELRTAVQLERRFSRRELFTIFANRAYFGDNLVGVDAASQSFFQKDPIQLRVGDAALLAGLIKSPSRFSPFEHPDRALQRRNEVLDAMVEAHFVDAERAEAAKALGILPRRTD
jgi:membrane peptidoglycan carboxypeptidase